MRFDPREHSRPPSETSIIGVVPIRPENIGANGEYIVSLPAGSRFMTAGLIDSMMFVWVVSPAPNGPESDFDDGTVYRKLFILPGNRLVQLSPLAVYVGTAILPTGGETGGPQDWHVFAHPADVTALPSEVQAGFETTYH